MPIVFSSIHNILPGHSQQTPILQKPQIPHDIYLSMSIYLALYDLGNIQ